MLYFRSPVIAVKNTDPKLVSLFPIDILPFTSCITLARLPPCLSFLTDAIEIVIALLS